MLEDDIVDVVAQRWRPVATVLAAGAGQGALHFHTREGRRKSPDLVLCVETAIVVCEAKVRAAGLFAGRESSDAAQVGSLLADPGRRTRFLARLRELARSIGMDVHQEAVLVGALIAGSRFAAAQLGRARPGVHRGEREGRDRARGGSGVAARVCVAALERPKGVG